MSLLLKKIILFPVTFIFAFAFITSASAEKLSSMVDSVLEDHEDIINSKKELEEALRDVTDALLVYAPDLSVKLEAGQNDKYNASSNSQIDSFDTYDWTWKQKIMDSGASLADVRNKNLAVKKKELELIGTRNDLLKHQKNLKHPLLLKKIQEKLQVKKKLEFKLGQG